MSDRPDYLRTCLAVSTILISELNIRLTSMMLS